MEPEFTGIIDSVHLKPAGTIELTDFSMDDADGEAAVTRERQEGTFIQELVLSQKTQPWRPLLQQLVELRHRSWPLAGLLTHRATPKPP